MGVETKLNVLKVPLRSKNVEVGQTYDFSVWHQTVPGWLQTNHQLRLEATSPDTLNLSALDPISGETTSEDAFVRERINEEKVFVPSKIPFVRRTFRWTETAAEQADALA